jgi:hypothetical protein
MTRFFTLLNAWDNRGSDRRQIQLTPCFDMLWIGMFPTGLHGALETAESLISHWDPRVTAFFSKEPPPGITIREPDCPAVNREYLRVFSGRLQKFVQERWPGCIEFLRFRTQNAIGEDITDHYALLHQLHWVLAVDRKHSVPLPYVTGLKRLAGQYLLDKIVLTRKKLIHPICRIKGWSDYHVFREDVVEAMQAQGFTGLVFEEIETV